MTNMGHRCVVITCHWQVHIHILIFSSSLQRWVIATLKSFELCAQQCYQKEGRVLTCTAALYCIYKHSQCLCLIPYLTIAQQILSGLDFWRELQSPNPADAIRLLSFLAESRKRQTGIISEWNWGTKGLKLFKQSKTVSNRHIIPFRALKSIW